MSERITVGPGHAEVFDLSELENTTHTLEGVPSEAADSSWTRSLKIDTDSETDNATEGTSSSEGSKEEDYNGRSTRNKNAPRGKKSRDEHDKKRSQNDPRNSKDQDNKSKDSPEHKPSAHEKWARKYLDEHVPLFNQRREYLKDENNKETGEHRLVEVPVSDATHALINSRQALAEAQVRVRSSGLLYSRGRREKQVEDAREKYLNDRQKLIVEVLENSDATLVQKRALAAILSAREDGALMGEEAQYYLSRQNSALNKAMEYFDSKSKATKVLIGIGVAATSGLLIGFAAGGIAAGGIAGSRLGRGYFVREARRNRNDMDEEQRRRLQEESGTLLQSNLEDYKGSYKTLKNFRKSKGQIDPTNLADVAGRLSEDLQNRSIGDYEKATVEAEEDTKRKHKSLGGAAVGAALGFGVGYALEHLADFNGSDEVDSGEAEATDTDPSEPRPYEGDDEAVPADPDADTELKEELGLNDDPEDEGPAHDPEEASISTEAGYLYGELAGADINLSIPEGSNIWNQLEAVVDDKMPGVNYGEKQRLVGNMLNRMEQAYPGRDLNLVYPGESFSMTLPS